jgi:hypothetical protein
MNGIFNPINRGVPFPRSVQSPVPAERLVLFALFGFASDWHGWNGEARIIASAP